MTALDAATESISEPLALGARPMDPPAATFPQTACRVTTNKLDQARLERALVQLCDGISALHRAGRLHRDLKPANVLVSSGDGRVLICDFGLTLLADDRAGREGDGAVRFDAERREVAGTLAFMSPEQAQARSLTPASDWYSFGVMLYLALTGHLPFPPWLPYAEAVSAKLTQMPPHPASLAPDAPQHLADLAMAMLHPDPLKRASYTDASAVLAAGSRLRRRDDVAEHGLLGREQELERLQRAFDKSLTGSPTLLLVSGVSGMGKSALVQHFLAHIERSAGALVLRSRCYEHEELPYKAFDPVIDALSSHLLTLPSALLAQLLPASVPFLARLFPALRRVPEIQKLSNDELSVADPLERRRLALQSFRELCARLCQRQPLALFIDDLQWGDLDSYPFFQELLAASEAPPIVILCAHRSDESEPRPLLALLRQLRSFEGRDLQVVQIEIGPLQAAHAELLARSFLGSAPGAARKAIQIAAESEGSPMFVRELADYVRGDAGAELGLVGLDALIQRKIETLSVSSRRLLDVLAVAGRPSGYAAVREVSGLDQDLSRALRELAARRLIHTSHHASGAHLECFHDRVRETAFARLAVDTARDIHLAFARQLEGEALLDCDALLHHWRGAGEWDKAREYAVLGARRAEATLAFSHAAELYRQAIALTTSGTASLRPLREAQGHALRLAGRSREAAAIFIALIDGATPEQLLNYRMLATTQLLRGGQIIDGFHELERADDLFGVRLPSSELEALAMLLTRRLRLRLRSQRALRPTVAETSEQHARLVSLWEVAAAVSSADFLRGTVYSTELMLRARRESDPVHAAGAYGLQAVDAAAAYDSPGIQHYVDLADRAAKLSGQLYILSRVRGMEAVARQLEGRWRDAIRSSRESQELLLRCGQVTWDYAIMIWWEMTCATQLGDLNLVARRVPEALRDAEMRGDAYAATEFRTHRCAYAWLAVDRPDFARQQVDLAEREWKAPGYQFQHWHMTFARAEVDLYCGTPRRSFERMAREWSRGRLVREVKPVATDMLYTRARLALCLANETRDPALLRRAAADGRSLLRQRRPWPVAMGRLIMAGVASFRDRARSAQLLQQTEQLLHATEMTLHLEAARARRATLQGGLEGRQMYQASLAKIAALGAQRPERWVAQLVPAAE